MICELCAIGSEEFLIPFRIFGFNAYTAQDDDSLREYLEDTIKKREVGIIYIEDSYCHRVKDILEQYRNMPTPIIMPIGASDGGESYAEQMNREIMQKAIGV